MDRKTAANLIKSEYMARRAAARARFERLLDGDDALAAAEKAVRAAILDGKPDDETARLTAERDRLLAAHGVTADDIDPPPRCKICGDTGYDANGRPCKCLKKFIADYING